VLEMRKKHGFMPKIHTCLGPDSHNEQTPTLKVPLQTELWFHLRRYEQPPTLEDLWSNRRPTDGSLTPAPAAATTTSAPGGQTAAAMASGRTLLQQGPRPRPRSRGEDGGGDPVGDEDFYSRHHLSADDGSHLPTGRSPLGSSRTSAEAPYWGKGSTAPEHERRP
jgi:hypothetical protein